MKYDIEEHLKYWAYGLLSDKGKDRLISALSMERDDIEEVGEHEGCKDYCIKQRRILDETL